MPALLTKFIFNKYTLAFVILASVVGYGQMLITKNAELSVLNDNLNRAIVKMQSELENKSNEVEIVEKIIVKDCEERIKIAENKNESLIVIKKHSSATKDQEKIDEKDILGSKLPDDILDRLRINP